MLSLAVQARIPIINIQTEDVMFLGELFKDQLGMVPKKVSSGEVAAKLQTGIQEGVYYMSETSSAKIADLVTLHKALNKSGATLILINCPKDHPTIFNVGPVMPSKETIAELVADALEDEDVAESLMSSLGGCGIKATTTYMMITSARDQTVTPEGLNRTRKQFFQGSKGLTQVDLDQAFYIPDPKLAEWLAGEKEFFLHADDPRLRARGILMDGRPGVGKTEGAKWIAKQLGVPLFRLDVASTKDKYVGESQRYLEMALANVSREAPCVLLFDEIEKVMSSKTNDTSGTSSEMLSQLLWWLAEHPHRVLTVMTTNDRKKIPPEMIRDGRIDKKMDIPGLNHDQAASFASNMLKTFGVDLKDGEQAMIEKIVEDAWSEELPDAAEVSHATVRKAVIGVLKSEFSTADLNKAIKGEK